jgi:2-polyprenyl-3-methyl-5-hydroxy-6-metoxy-1,4-benzoquinol methylase
LFEFSNGAVDLVSAYVALARKRMSQTVFDEADKQCLEVFLSDFEDDIRFYAIQISRTRKAGIVEKRDVREASKGLLVEVWRRPEALLRPYKKTLADMDILKERVKSSGNSWVLDAGCGWGKASRRICRYLGKEMEAVGVDLDVPSLKYGKGVNPDFSFVRSSMSCLPFKPGVFNIVVSNRSLHEVRDADNREKAVKEFSQVLKMEGVLYIFDMFERCLMTKLFRSFLRRVFLKGEPYSECSVLERKLHRMDLRLIRRECMVWSALSLKMLCSYVAVKT